MLAPLPRVLTCVAVDGSPGRHCTRKPGTSRHRHGTRTARTSPISSSDGIDHGCPPSVVLSPSGLPTGCRATEAAEGRTYVAMDEEEKRQSIQHHAQPTIQKIKEVKASPNPGVANSASR